MHVFPAGGSITVIALRTAPPAYRTNSFVSVATFLIAQASIPFPAVSAGERFADATAIAVFTEDVSVSSAGGAVIVIASLTFAPADRPDTFIAGFAFGIA
jgi:uncharacterized membrane protein YbhN (UPF0104 family)